uniref:Secologanin synthase n=1 Tax=Aegilops tauschii TaxID=37682 RepID=M8BFN7_AEGTA
MTFDRLDGTSERPQCSYRFAKIRSCGGIHRPMRYIVRTPRKSENRNLINRGIALRLHLRKRAEDKQATKEGYHRPGHARHRFDGIGRVFLYWFGSTPNICVADLGVAKQLLSDRTGLFPKNRMNPIVRLVGKGLVMTDGDVWHRHKKVLHTAFNVDKLKVMTSTMVDCVLSMASRYREGRKIFLALNEIQFIAFSTLWTDYIPGFRFVPTKKNMRLWKLNKTMRSTLVQIIENRLAAQDTDGYGSDLLGLMLEACAPEHGQAPVLSMDEMIDECKTFFFAGQETSLHMLNWTMFLLGTHPEWQQRLREEAEAGEPVPAGDAVPLIRRRTRSEVELGGVTVPRDALLTIPIATMHRDREVWGEDADEFNPMRFDGGAARAARHANALLSFSMGPRTCIGQNFAMVQAKAEVAVILRRFALSLSPSYVHAPTDVITLRPKYGLPMIITRLDA